MTPFVWLNGSGNHKLAMADWLTARRKSWHGQATWLLCIPNLSSFTCYSLFNYCQCNHHGCSRLGSFKTREQNSSQKHADMSHSSSISRNDHPKTVLLLTCPNEFWVFRLDLPSIHKTIKNKCRHSSRIHKNCSGFSCLNITIDFVLALFYCL